MESRRLTRMQMDADKENSTQTSGLGEKGPPPPRCCCCESRSRSSASSAAAERESVEQWKLMRGRRDEGSVVLEENGRSPCWLRVPNPKHPGRKEREMRTSPGSLFFPNGSNLKAAQSQPRPTAALARSPCFPSWMHPISARKLSLPCDEPQTHPAPDQSRMLSERSRRDPRLPSEFFLPEPSSSREAGGPESIISQPSPCAPFLANL